MNSDFMQESSFPTDEPDKILEGESINLDFKDFLNSGQKMEEFKEEDDTLSLSSSFKEASDKFEQGNREKRNNMSKSSLKEDGDSAILLDNVPNLSYQVREYQGEIFEKSKDKNSIILLETGSGKTIISLLHILHCLKKENAPKKIAFLCLQINLVEQQTLKVRSFLRAMQLREEFRYLEQLQPMVITLHGGKGDDAWKHISTILRRTNPQIMVMTPQYLLNGLRKGYVKMEEFALIVFDECHHCTQNHPYNMIMQEFYHKPWVANRGPKPQILGLTATPITVTKQINTGEIEQKLLQICHNLDSNFCTLEENKIEEGQKSEAEIHTFSYVQDPQLDEVDVLAEADQRKLTSVYQGINIIHSWNLALAEIFECLEDQEPGEEAMTAQMRMSIEDFFKSKIANRAIALYLELGPYAVYLHFLDIYEQLETVMNGFGFTTLDANKLKKIRALLLVFLKKIGTFSDSSKLSEKCLTLLKLLNAIMKEKPDNTGIVFVERKYIARVLKKIINTKIPGDLVKAEYIIGHNYFGLTAQDDIKEDVDPDLEPSINVISQRIRPLGEVDDVKKEGKHFKKLFNPRQTLQTQLRHIDLFKEGKFNVLIATSLIQEGFDVPNSNFVVSFSEPKTILQMVQIRGRARMLGSKYYILLPKNTEEQKKQKFQFGLMLMGKIKKIAAEFERQISSEVIRNADRIDIPEAISENGGRLNTNWADWLTNLLCKSIPATSIDYNKPFYMVIGHTEGNRTGFTGIVLLPNQCNVRIKRGEMYTTKNDAKKSAAFLCCQQLMGLEYFDSHLNPKSMNKDYSEFVDIKIDPLSGKFQSEFIEKLNNLYLSSNNFSHFAKPFYKIPEEAQEKKRDTYGGFLYHLKLNRDPNSTHETSEDLTICIVHPSRLPENFEFNKEGFPAINIVFKREIYFNASEYKDLMLIHRYLISFADSRLLQFFSTLAGDPPKHHNIEEKKLDYEYELWITHQPTLSFFVLTNHKFDLASKFNSTLKEYIQYQMKFYLYLNSVNHQEEQTTSLWDQPKIKHSFYQTKDSDQLKHYVLQDVWRLGNYQLNQIQDLATVDYYASSDGFANLQHRTIFFIDRFLEQNGDPEYDKGLEVIDLKDKTIQKIFFDIEIMVSPISINLFLQLKTVLTSFKAFPQSRLSLKSYQENMNRSIEYDPPRVLPCNIDLSDFIEMFSFFEEHCLKEQHFFYQPEPLRSKLSILRELPRYKKRQEDIENIEKTLEEIFVIEKNTNNVAEDSDQSLFEIMGSRLIELLLSIEVFFANPREWDYSLEKIKKKKLSKWKKGSMFLNELARLCVSERANNFLCDAIIPEIDRDQGKICAEYIARSGLSKIIKNTAYLLYDKENGKLDKIKEFLCKTELLDYEKLNIKLNSVIQQGQSIEVLRHIYDIRHAKLEQTIGYSFQNKFILLDAFMEISFRDYFVEWIETEGPLANSFKMLELRKTVFQQKGEEYSVPANNGLSIEKLFPEFIEQAINDHHKKPNDLDRFKWLGQVLVEFIVLEWLQETFSHQMSELELKMHAKYLSETQFITYLSWAYNLEDYVITHRNCYDMLKRTKNYTKPRDLLTRSFYLDQGNFTKKKLCYISASLFYSLITAIFLDCKLDLNMTRERTLSLIVPAAMDCIQRGFIRDYAPFKLETLCEKKGWPRPVIKKASLSEQDSYKMPASSIYQLKIGDEIYSSLVDSSLKNVEYALYVAALEKIEGKGF